MVISLLPFPLLYLLADFLFFMLYHVTGYRKRVVYYNLKLSFPDKQEYEIFKIRKQFYKHLSDLMLETIKGFTISKKQLLKRVIIESEPMRQAAEENRSILLLLGHYGNWEWGGQCASIAQRHQMHIVYHELSNGSFDKLFYRMRGRFGAHLSKMEEVFRRLIQLRSELIATCLVADQNPDPTTAYWGEFLNRKTAFFKGPAKIGRKLNNPIFYASMQKVKRGYYTLVPTLISYNPQEETEEVILDEYIRRLEEDINHKPEFWLWSHRRWKHKYEDHHEEVIS